MPAQHGLWPDDPNNSKQARPQPGQQYEKEAVAVPEPRSYVTQSDIELMPEKQIFGFKPAARLEQVNYEHPKRMEDREHRSQ
jgi:hypothetical protein